MRVSFLPSTRRVWPVAVALVLVAASTASASAVQTGSYRDLVCHREFQSAQTTSIQAPLLNGDPFDLEVAMMHFRFNRPRQALATIDEALKTAAGPWRYRIPSDLRAQLMADLADFRKCVATSRVPEMATLTVRVVRGEFDDAAPGGRLEPAPGATVSIEDVPVGRTGDDGTLTVQVPSGEIRVTAEIPRTFWGADSISLPPGGFGAISIGLHDGKEVTEDSELILLEAVDDIIPASSPSFTLQFMRQGVPVPLRDIEQIDLLDRLGDLSDHDIEKLFALRNGTIAATDTAALFAAMATHFDDTITLRVRAIDTAELGHTGDIRFRVGQSPLVVTLAAPPSNPGVRISDVEVGISLMGAGIGVHRISDAIGRVEVDSFPHGTIEFDAEVKQDGRYYYGQATMTHFGQRSVTLVLRHVSDIVNGVPALELGPATAERPPAPRRSGGAQRER